MMNNKLNLRDPTDRATRFVAYVTGGNFVRECFCFGSEAVHTRCEAVRGLVKPFVGYIVVPNRLASADSRLLKTEKKI